MKIHCDTNQFKKLTFSGPHSKPHGVRGLSKNYHLRFDPNLGHGICSIFCIPFSCVECTIIPDQPWIYGTPLKKKHVNKLSQIVLTSQFWAHITIGISFI